MLILWPGLLPPSIGYCVLLGYRMWTDLLVLELTVEDLREGCRSVGRGLVQELEDPRVGRWNQRPNHLCGLAVHRSCRF